ncbi:unnamed protein product [Somion occarium]|uniref:FHA domain-containing protein n=1 Tax=Somion occarium TaxID=3059160 RepID=A0ABP1D4K1_9APHY
MWVITGPFDGALNALNVQKSKLLKPGRTYVLGRKDRALVVNHKSVSRDHLSFTVGAYSEEDVSDPDTKPTLELHNTGSKSRRVEREDQALNVNAQSSLQLQDGDKIFVLNDVTLSIKWETVCCYFPTHDTSVIPYTGCAKLGISVVLTPHPSVTHHITPTLSLSPQIACSLLTLAHFIRPDWLTAVLQLGVSVHSTATTQIDAPPTERPSRLEASFALPRIADYRPDYSPAIASSMRSLKVWEPNEGRLNFFHGRRFIFVGERGREVSVDLREVVKRGGGEYECFAVEGGWSSFHAVLAKGQGKGKPLILVADEHDMGLAVGQDKWMEIVREAAEYNLHFIRLEKLAQAIMHVDLSYVDCMLKEPLNDPHRFASPLPDVIPNTHLDEPSLPVSQFRTVTPPPAPSPSQPPGRKTRRLVRHDSSDERFDQAVANAAASGSTTTISAKGPSAQVEEQSGKASRDGNVAADEQASMENQEPQQVPQPPRRRPTRRPINRKPLFGDDDSVLQDGESSTAESVTPAPIPSSAQAPEKPSSSRTVPRRRPKRRVIGGAPLLGQEDHDVDATSALEAEAVEPPLKKFKALYEESDPDRIAQSGMEEYLTMYRGLDSTGSMTQSETQMPGSSRMQGRLDVVREEEEEPSTVPSQSVVVGEQTQAGSRLKRKVRMEEPAEDVEMEDAEQPRPKRRAVEGVDAVQPATAIPPSQTQSKSSAPTKPPSAKGFSSRAQSQAEKSQQSSSGVGAAPGKPDRDEAFLKAVASTKRGRKHEDTFDREFNNLKISKPDLRKEEAEKEWGVLEQFGDDGDVRGNFMVVVEMDVPRREARTSYRHGEGRVEWEGRPDFKKFKKKAVGERRKPVELVLNVDPDDSFPSQMRKASQSQNAPQNDLFNLASAQERKMQTQLQGTQAVVQDSSEENILQPINARRSQREPSPVHIQVPPARTRYKRQPKYMPNEPLFLESDEDVDMNDDDAGEHSSQVYATRSQTDEVIFKEEVIRDRAR